MIYEQVSPKKELAHIIKSFWLIDSEGDGTIRQEKIIPDGYPELIFHYGDPYRININGSWELQEKSILAGQIRNYFFLENTGESKMFAIKLQPWIPKELFGAEMPTITDQVIPVQGAMLATLKVVQNIAVSSISFNDKVSQIEDWFDRFVLDKDLSMKYWVVQKMIGEKGSISLKQLQEEYHIGERSLERYFKTYIGLPPKFYARIIRFSYIFQLVQEKEIDWSDIVYRAGYYDQSHFIKNFQEFTGEDPSKYGFSEKNMANFLLKP
ncbi:helix-turn-helix transcriptional regulator [Flavobacteriaceae bacterium S356]|uniref:Helix-turn-helix transcriptional regulator n=1 Tax=Asprobacillus argus TaxID=3076534 RepID=A0ABU3LD57_9FLAO|nr:helix-turn-helix transcriptional regulator [Flavobacteriaceae bacterium S356]